MGKKHSRSTANILQNPLIAYPAVGDTWDELDIGGTWVESWFWNGTYWLSTNVFNKFISWENLAATNNYYWVDGITSFSTSRYNLFLIEQSKSLYIIGTNNGANNWGVNLSRQSPTSRTQLLGSSTVSLGTMTGFVNETSSINTHINIDSTNTKAMVLSVIRSGNPGVLNGGFNLKYRKARL